jgi:hypothetical protein
LTSLPEGFPPEIVGFVIAISDFQPAYPGEAEYARQGDEGENDEFEYAENILKSDAPGKEGAMDQENECQTREGNKSSVEIRGRDRKGMQKV